MARRFKPLTFQRISELPCECARCAYWETDRAQPTLCGSPSDAEALKASFSAVESQWGDYGRIAYQDKDQLGFIKYAPPGFVPRAAALPSGPPSVDAVLLCCMHVRPEVRHLGLGKVIVHAALRDIIGKGVKAVEAFGTTSADTDRSPMISVNFLLKQGFTVERPHPEFPLMRLDLKSLAVWTENVEAILESMQIRLRLPKRVPAPSR